jgi:N-acetylmuramoyl-L-alanine amidase
MEKPEGEIFIIPARLEECDNLESLRKWHWVDLFEDDGYEMLMRALRVRAYKIGVAVEKPAHEKAEQGATEKARLKIEEQARQKATKDKAEREIKKVIKKAKRDLWWGRFKIDIRYRFRVIYIYRVPILILLFTLAIVIPLSIDLYNKFPEMVQTINNTPINTPQPQLRIGIIAGDNGSGLGVVCLDANGQVKLTEADLNLKIATMVQKNLAAQGFQVDLLNEFDSRLNGYQAVALISIHNDSCDYINNDATGFKVVSSLNTRDSNRAQRLTNCLTDRYERSTGLRFHANSITADMTEYHAFSEVDPNTISAIITTGFLNLDYKILTEETERIASGVTQGILCFINNENILPTPLSPILP